MTYNMTTCDICGRDASQLDDGIVHRYKVKQERYGWERIGCNRWKRIDICRDCLNELRRISREKGKGEK